MWKAWTLGVVFVLAVVASLLTIWQVSGFYPLGVIVLLAAGLAAALGVLWETAGVTGWKDPAARAHDSRIVREVRELIRREHLEEVRSCDFGAAWRKDLVSPFFELERLDHLENRPHDRQIKRTLRRLLDANAAFLTALGEHSWQDRDYSELRNVGWRSHAEALGEYARNPLADPGELWEKRRGLLNEAATTVAEAYDKFAEAARRRHLLDTGEPSGGV